ncbi:MAG: glutamate-5-semialdehyde dehydrogenase [Gammaproteobacteria bacterium]|nr:glutamate-5-semialdehyde dehydrogenase [Gammaproteobacteria bacterium]
MNDSTHNSGADVRAGLKQIGAAARTCAAVIGAAETPVKNGALHAIARQLDRSREQLLKENAADLEAARARGTGGAMLDRLELTAARMDAMIAGVREIADLPDPVGEISGVQARPSGIRVGRMRTPLGVVGIIYEARPNVTADAAALCLKSGNASILRGGSEAIHSNRAIAACIERGLGEAGLPAACVQVVKTPGRESVSAMLALDDCIDVIIPRGGKGLIERVAAESKIPVIKHLDGICHVYVDDGADIGMALDIAENAKAQRFGVCNAMETLLVAESVAAEFLPRFAARMQKRKVELRGCDKTRRVLPDIAAAADGDWREEYLAPILSVKTVAGMDEAIAHIGAWGSKHTDAIVTRDHARAMRFLREVDSSSVIINASTRFSDGHEYGLGAEIGISTDVLHVRGPVGLEGLTTQKFVVFGGGQVRE